MSHLQRHGILQQGGAVPDSVDINKYSITFDFEGTECEIPGVTVTSSGAWTAAWLSGGLFNADKYAGNNGETITISCISGNPDPFNIEDTLRITRGGATVDLDVTQLEYGMGCD